MMRVFYSHSNQAWMMLFSKSSSIEDADVMSFDGENKWICRSVLKDRLLEHKLILNDDNTITPAERNNYDNCGFCGTEIPQVM